MDRPLWTAIIDQALRQGRLRSRHPAVTATILQKALSHVGLNAKVLQRDMRIETEWNTPDKRGETAYLREQSQIVLSCQGTLFGLRNPIEKSWLDVLRQAYASVSYNRTDTLDLARFIDRAAPLKREPKGEAISPQLVDKCAQIFREHNLAALWPVAPERDPIEVMMERLCAQMMYPYGESEIYCGQMFTEALSSRGIEAKLLQRKHTRHTKYGLETRMQLLVAALGREFHLTEGGEEGGNLSLRQETPCGGSVDWQCVSKPVSDVFVPLQALSALSGPVGQLADAVVLRYLEEHVPQGAPNPRLRM